MNSANAGGPQVSSKILDDAKAAYNEADKAYHNFLFNVYNRAPSLDTPSSEFPYIPHSRHKGENNSKPVTLSDGETLFANSFDSDIIIFDYLPNDAGETRCAPGPCLNLSYSRDDLRSGFSGKTKNREMQADFNRSLELAAERHFNFSKSIDDFSSAVIAGHLAHDFPTDTYHYEFNVHFGGSSSDVMPVLIFRRSSGLAVAAARLRASPTVDPHLFKNFWDYLRH